MRREVALVAALISLGAALAAHADPAADAAADQLRRARAALDASNYGDARPLLADALASGANDPAEVAELYKLTGITAAALGDDTAATDAFARALAIMPSTTLERGTSPKITRPFAAARQQLAGRALRAHASAASDTLVVVITDDPLSMVTGARVELRGNAAPPQTVASARAGDEVDVALPRGQWVEARAALVDARGNRLAELAPVAIGFRGNRVNALASEGAVDGGKNHLGGDPLYLRFYTYAAPSAVAFALAAGFGVAARDRTDNLSALLAMAPHYTYPEAQLLYNRARSDALDANVLFAVGGVLAAATAATLAYDLLGHRRAERLALLPTPAGATITCRLAF
jgi:hypothetical protein